MIVLGDPPEAWQALGFDVRESFFVMSGYFYDSLEC